MAAGVTCLSRQEGVPPCLRTSPPLGGTLEVHRTSWRIPFPRHACTFLVLGSEALDCRTLRLESQRSAGLRMQPYPRSPDLVWPGHLHGTGCPWARAVGTGFPTVVWRLCLGPVCVWVWVLLTPPVLAGDLGGCVWPRFVVLSLFCRLFVVFVVGLRFRPAPGTCVVSCALCLSPAVSGSGVRLGRACWARVSAVPRPSWLGCRGVFFARLFFVVLVAGCPCPGPCAPCPPIPFLSSWAAGSFFFFFVVCVCMFRYPFSWLAAVPGLVLPVLPGWSPCVSLGVLSSVPSEWGVWPPLVVLVGGLVAVGCFRAPPPLPPLFYLGGGACLFLPLPSLGWRTHWPAFSVLFRAAVGGCVLLGRVPAPWVGRAMYTLGSAPLPAGLGLGCRLGGCARRLRVALG